MKKTFVFLFLLMMGVGIVFVIASNFGEDFNICGLRLDEIVLCPREESEGLDSLSKQNESGNENSSDSPITNIFNECFNVVEPISGNYAFSQLSANEQRVYNEIFVSLINCEKSTTLSTLDKTLIDKAFDCVMMDHPEIFYVDGYQYTEFTVADKLDKITFEGNYLYDKSTIKKRMKQIDKVVDEMKDSAPKTVDEYELVKYAYDTIIYYTDYDLKSEDNQNICSVFLNGRSVCQGYAKAFQYLLAKLGVNATTVIGKVKDGEGHAWNLVQMNGKWYHVDTTWGDAYCLLTGQEDDQLQSDNVNYDYLAVTTELISRTHTLNTPVDVPDCTSLKDNYFVRENAYFYSYNQDAIQKLFQTAYSRGDETVTIKCSDDYVFEEMRAHLIVQQDIFKFLNRAEGTIAYTHNPKQRSLTFWL